jgi:hypothetical protein
LLIANMWRNFGLRSSHILNVFLAINGQYFMSK